MIDWYYVWPQSVRIERVSIVALVASTVIFYFASKSFLNKRIRKFITGGILLAVWGYVLFSLTLKGRIATYQRAELQFFWTVKSAWTNVDSEDWFMILGNLAAFIPFGILVPWMIKSMRKYWKIFVPSFLISLIIESLQYLWAKGLFELDDLYHNTMGALIGYSIFVLGLWIGRDKSVKKYEKVLAVSIIGGWSLFFVIALACGQPVLGYIFVK